MSEKILRLMGRLPGNVPSVSHDSAAKTEEPAAAAAPADVQDRKRIRKAALLKLGAMCAFLGVVVVFMTISWFTMSREVEGADTELSAEYRGFELEVQSGNVGYSSLYSYLDRAFSANTDLRTNTNEHGDTIRWRISGEDDVLRPGAKGTLSFKVISTGANINTLRYSLSISSFTADTSRESSENDEHETVEIEVVKGLDEITSDTEKEEEKAGADYLTSHLMFFKKKTVDSDNNIQYYQFISDINDFTLELDENNETEIYWIWPKTFGQIALDSKQVYEEDAAHYDQLYLGAGSISVLDITNGSSDRAAITSYLKSKKSNNSYVVFNGTDNYGALLDSLYNKRENDNDFKDEYSKLSDGYNNADRIIGNNVDYAMVVLNARAL